MSKRNSAGLRIHGSGPVTDGSTYAMTEHDAVAVTLEYAGTDVTMFLEGNREDLSTTAAVFRVIADKIDAASDELMRARMRSSLLEVSQ